MIFRYLLHFEEINKKLGYNVHVTTSASSKPRNSRSVYRSAGTPLPVPPPASSTATSSGKVKEKEKEKTGATGQAQDGQKPALKKKPTSLPPAAPAVTN